VAEERGHDLTLGVERIDDCDLSLVQPGRVNDSGPILLVAGKCGCGPIRVLGMVNDYDEIHALERQNDYVQILLVVAKNGSGPTRVLEKANDCGEIHVLERVSGCDLILVLGGTNGNGLILVLERESGFDLIPVPERASGCGGSHGLEKLTCYDRDWDPNCG